MKALELTKEHKAKLLEMCIALFPNYAIGNYLNSGFISFGNGIDETPVFRMHWFEFCMTHLANKIYYPDLNNIARGARNKIQSFFFSTFMEAIEGGTAGYDHPIDYLYSDFKKITVKQSKERFCHECNSWGNGCGQCV